MELYRDETREILKRFFEDRISRPECIDALDCALLAAIPHLNPADLPAVQSILIENARWLAKIDVKKPDRAVTVSRGVIVSMDQREHVPGSR